MQIKNPFIYGMWQKNQFKLGEHITSMGAAFYIAPFVNAILRSGDQEEKDIVFRSMLEQDAHEKILSNKRGHSLGEKEYLVDQALRICTNVKNRQDKSVKTGIEKLENKILKEGLLNHKVLLILLEKGEIEKNIAGLIANRLANKYQRPCAILTRTGENVYQGSARGYERTGIKNFREICLSSSATEYAEGHNNAFGLSLLDGIDQTGIRNFIENADNRLHDFTTESIYYVDDVWKVEDIKEENILEIADLESLWGKDVEEPLFAIENIRVNKDSVFLMKANTLKIVLPNKVSIIKFGATDEEYESLLADGYVEINAICRCSKNEWNDNIYPQFILEDFEVISKCEWDF
jgi:single-stranded-DNA-specific exonuclease